ncbi:MAG: hypothetical protein GX197_08150 [Firmicutes bacterium]|nr:hypothetical protein [Bacillota bacterium]
MSNSCSCSESDQLSGCLVCGQDLYYLPNKPLRARCYYCGKEAITHSFCLEGHYVCDDCHAGSILELVAQVCQKSDLTDPLALLLEVFKLPNLKMHGPEYHSIVPAVLVTAFGNSSKQKDHAIISEAIARGKTVPGGVCGTHGSCGACIGIGIAYSLIHQVTPYAKKHRGNANRMTALALDAISKLGGPRCCKREATLAIETARKYFNCFELDDSGKNKYLCSQFRRNEMCIKDACPYYPLTDHK